MLGIFLVDKPHGISSHDAVNQIRRKFHTKRVGHAGTLDPLATGLLVIAIGPATRFLQYLPLEPKTYEAEITFGRSTTTQDAEGETVAEREVPIDLRSAIEKVMPQFSGLITQVPPMFSAVKVNGQPLYHAARRGEEIERKARKVFLTEFSLQSIDANVAHFRITCSGGTYVRTLAHELGEAVGCGAFLSALVRTQAGAFHLEQGSALSELEATDCISLASALSHIPHLNLDLAREENVRMGRRISNESKVEAELVALCTAEGTVFGIGRVLDTEIQPECVIPNEVPLVSR